MSHSAMSPEVLALIAARFKALSEPARLQILSTLRSGELSVGELVDLTGLGQANVSRHLQVLHNGAFVRRRRDGPFVYYALADRSVFQLCDIMCGQMERQVSTRGRLLARGVVSKG